MAEVKKIVIEGIDKIDSIKWKKCVKHIREREGQEHT